MRQTISISDPGSRTFSLFPLCSDQIDFLMRSTSRQSMPDFIQNALTGCTTLSLNGKTTYGDILSMHSVRTINMGTVGGCLMYILVWIIPGPFSSMLVIFKKDMGKIQRLYDLFWESDSIWSQKSVIKFRKSYLVRLKVLVTARISTLWLV